jgi:2-methylaconitate cis-trans-isomerase PrpF
MSKLIPIRRLPLPTRPSLRVPYHRLFSTKTKPQNRLLAAYYRGGTSRAVIFDAKDLPQDRTQWSDIFRGVIGSPDRYGRQLDGLGGGISSLSKVCVVGPAQPRDSEILDENGRIKETAEADVDYTFAAIGVTDGDVDFSSNCGNMSAAIGPYAYDHHLVPHIENSNGEATVRIRNTNSGKVIHSKFSVVNGEAASSGTFAIDGVEGTGARVRLDFLDPA